jgi:AP-4 complex subunit epsilon-1
MQFSITSENHNLKYLGINALASIVQVDPKYAAEHQLVVIDCMEDPDETLRRKTLDLLYRMTNPSNVVVVVDKLVARLANKNTVDEYLRSELMSKITSLAERYAPIPAWYIQVMNTVFELGGNLVRPEVTHDLMRLIAEGAGHVAFLLLLLLVVEMNFIV